MPSTTRVAAGCSDADIAAGLHLSPRTVNHRVQSILTKLDVKNRVQATAHALEYFTTGQWSVETLICRARRCEQCWARVGFAGHIASSACIVANITRWTHKTMVVLALRDATTLI